MNQFSLDINISPEKWVSAIIFVWHCMERHWLPLLEQEDLSLNQHRGVSVQTKPWVWWATGFGPQKLNSGSSLRLQGAGEDCCLPELLFLRIAAYQNCTSRTSRETQTASERALQGSEARISLFHWQSSWHRFHSAASQQQGRAGVRCQTTALEAAAMLQKERQAHITAPVQRIRKGCESTQGPLEQSSFRNIKSLPWAGLLGRQVIHLDHIS